MKISKSTNYLHASQSIFKVIWNLFFPILSWVPLRIFSIVMISPQNNSNHLLMFTFYSICSILFFHYIDKSTTYFLLASLQLYHFLPPLWFFLTEVYTRRPCQLLPQSPLSVTTFKVQHNANLGLLEFLNFLDFVC